jgi:hypothetical protein
MQLLGQDYGRRSGHAQFQNRHVILTKREIDGRGLDKLRDERRPVVRPFLFQDLFALCVRLRHVSHI